MYIYMYVCIIVCVIDTTDTRTDTRTDRQTDRQTDTKGHYSLCPISPSSIYKKTLPIMRRQWKPSNH